MNTLVESGLLTEQVCGSNLSYVLNEASEFQITDYKILQSNDKGTFVKCMKMLFNGKIQLFYLVNGLRSFESMLSMMDSDKFITITANIFQSVLEVRGNGFLRIGNIDSSMKHIYIDPMTSKTYLLYLPLKKGFYPDDVTFENEFRASFAKLILGVSTLTSPETMQLFANLQNAAIPMEKIFDNINRIRVSDDEETIKVAKGIGELKLISMNAPEKYVFCINKESYTIGRSQKHADGVIKDNKMIGRVHCRIDTTDDGYVLVDLESVNGTSINCVQLQSGVGEKIKNGDVVRLANYDFKVMIK